jgi:hypothetical protein
MSKGAGRIERGVRAEIAARNGFYRFYPGVLCRTLFGVTEPTRAQRESVLRAFRRITRDQPGWRRELRHGEVVYVFDSKAVDRPKSKRTAVANLLSRPVPQREQRAQAAAKKRARRERRTASPELTTAPPEVAVRETSPLLKIYDELQNVSTSALLAAYVPNGPAAAGFRAEVKALVELLQVSGCYAPTPIPASEGWRSIMVVRSEAQSGHHSKLDPLHES